MSDAQKSEVGFGSIVIFMSAVALIIIAILVGIWVFISAMEAHAFNSATGKRVSTWDAMWIELRVMESSK